jgi:Alginate lyase
MTNAARHPINRRFFLGLAAAVPLAACEPIAGGAQTPTSPVASSSQASTAATSATAAAAAPSAAATATATAIASPSPSASPSAMASASPGVSAGHPGLLHTQADFDRMAAKVSGSTQPWKAGWDRLVANSHSRSGWKPNPQATVYRGSGTPENYATLYNDIHAAYQNALRWKITDDSAHGDTARDILNAWSGTFTTLTGTADRFIAAGIYGYQFANAAELMRGYPGFDLDRFKTMMLSVFYPLNNDFLVNHNGAFITNYWGSWDELTMASILAIGILCDDQTKVDQAVTYFKTGAGPGAIANAVPVLYSDSLGEWVEAGRDQGHATLGIGLTAAVCEMAWNQGIDLYGYDDNRFMKGAEYVAKYNLGNDVPYTPYTWNYGAPGVWSGSQTFTAASPDGRGDVRPIWEMIYNHYVGRKGLSVPNITAYAAKVRPEGGGGDYGPDSGGFDQLGFGTLAFTR